MRLLRACVPVLTTSFLLGACSADRYLIGDVDDGGALPSDAGVGGGPGTGGSASGGSPAGGGGAGVGEGGAGGANAGGATPFPGTGGAAIGGSAGSAATGGAGSAGSGSAGSIGTGGSPAFACGFGPAPLPLRKLAISPEQAADRLSRFLLGRRADEFLVMRASGLATNADAMALARTLLEGFDSYEGIEALVAGWLELEKVATFPGAPEVSAAVDSELRASMAMETRIFMRDLLHSREGTLRTMLTAPYTFADHRLSPLYGLPVPQSQSFERVELPPGARSGILTQPSFLFTKPHISARGTWVRSKLLCQEVPPPPANVVIPPLGNEPGFTYREALQRELANPACAACHALTDPPGFALEHYDAIGRYRSLDNGKPIDSSGVLVGLQGPELTFIDAPELGQKLAGACDVQLCMAQVFLSRALGGPLRESDQASKMELASAFAATGFNLHELMILATGTQSFLAP